MLNAILTSCLSFPFISYQCIWQDDPLFLKKQKRSIPVRIDSPFLFTSPIIPFFLQYTAYPFWGIGAWETIKSRGSGYSYTNYFFLSFWFLLLLDCFGEFSLSYLSSQIWVLLCILTSEMCRSRGPSCEAVCFLLLNSPWILRPTAYSQAPLEAQRRHWCFSVGTSLCVDNPGSPASDITEKLCSLILWVSYKKFHQIIFKTVLLVLPTIAKIIALYGYVLHHQQKINELGFQL